MGNGAGGQLVPWGLQPPNLPEAQGFLGVKAHTPTRPPLKLNLWFWKDLPLSLANGTLDHLDDGDPQGMLGSPTLGLWLHGLTVVLCFLQCLRAHSS